MTGIILRRRLMGATEGGRVGVFTIIMPDESRVDVPFEIGMTWAQFCESSYNTLPAYSSFSINSNGYVILNYGESTATYDVTDSSDGQTVLGTDTIIENGEYGSEGGSEDEDTGGTKTLAIMGPDNVTGETVQLSLIADGNAVDINAANWRFVETPDSENEYAMMSDVGQITILTGANNAAIVIGATYMDVYAQKIIYVTYQSGRNTDTQTQTTDDGSGNTSTTTITVITNGDGSSETNSTTINYDSNGDVTGSSTNTTTTNADGSSNSITINYDENGDETGHESTTGDTSGNIQTQTVEKDENGNDVVTSYLIDTSNNTGKTMASSEAIGTGFIPFDGSSDWELDFKFKYDWDRNVDSGSTVVTVLSCGDYESGVLSSGFLVRFYAAKATASSTTPKTRPFINVSQNGTSTTRYAFITGSGGRVYTDPVIYVIHITKVGTTVTFTISVVGELRYNKTTDRTSGTNYVVANNPSQTLTWESTSTSTIDITIGGYLSSSGSIAQEADIDVYEFDVHKI